MRNLFSALMVVCAALAALPAAADDRLNVVASFSILGDMVRQVAGDKAAVMTIVGPDADAHIYTPSTGDAKAVTKLANEHGPNAPLQRLTGGGYVAFTVDQGRHAERYQGIVELTCASLTECTQAYFRNSEQLQTGIKIAATVVNGAWRTSSLMIQRLAFSGGDGVPAWITEDEYDEGWRTAIVLMSSCTSDELVKATLSPEALLYRLFHETGVRIYPDQTVEARCRCSVGKVERVLRSLTTEQLKDMTVDGEVWVVCEFCKDERRYDEEALAALRST